MVFSRLAERFTLSDYAYAHRGLWTADGLTENSLEALLAAAENGLGIEFDVRPAADGVPIIFHDPVLERMTGEAGAVAKMVEALYEGPRWARVDRVETAPADVADVPPGFRITQ